MTKTNINITNNTIIEAHGNHTNGNTKSVYIVEKRKAYTSMTDAAEAIGCSLDAISNVVRGKQKTAKGYHVVLLSKVEESFPIIMEQFEDIDVLRAKAAAYDKMMAEQEKARKAEEKKAKAIHEAEMTVLKYEGKCKAAEAKCTQFQTQLDKNAAKLLVAQQKLMMLKGNGGTV